MGTNKNIFLWVLYDFANSIILIVFFLYFSQWIVIERGIPDLWFNLSFTTAALLLLCTVPLMGVLLDKYWRRITVIRIATFATAFFYGSCALFATQGSSTAALTAFTVGLYFYLLSFTVYTPLIADIANAERQGRVSGYGIGANHLGQIAGLLLVLPFATGNLSWFGASSRAETLLPAVIGFLVCALPTLLFFKEPLKEKKTFSYTKEMKECLTEAKTLFVFPGIGAFLIAYFLFNDAISTASNNFSIFLEQVWSVPDTTKTLLLLAILLMSSIGGFVSGYIADTIGHKRTLTYILVGWVLILPAVALISNFTLFVGVVVLMGLWFGASWTVSRSLMSILAPAHKKNLTFGYFGLVERASSFVGPLVWGGVATGLVSLGPDRYRIAATVLTIFVAMSLVALTKVPNDRKVV